MAPATWRGGVEARKAAEVVLTCTRVAGCVSTPPLSPPRCCAFTATTLRCAAAQACRHSRVTVADDSEEAAAPEPPPVEVQDEPVAEEVEEANSPVAEGTPDGGCGEDDRHEWVELPAPPPPRSILRDAVKSVRFSALPPVLVLTLKRFRQEVRGRTRKLSGHVSFEEELDVGALCDGSLQPSYQLRGVVEHSGGLSGGHYVAYVRRAGDQQWHYISDRHVRPVTAATVFDAEAYLLFYERV